MIRLCTARAVGAAIAPVNGGLKEEREGLGLSQIVGFNPMETGAMMSDKPISPLVSAHDRRHDGASIQGEGAERLRPARQNLRGLTRPFAGHGHERGSAIVFCIWPSSRSAQVHQRRGSPRCGSFSP